MLDQEQVSKARYSAMNLLARREHSYGELERKLKQRAFADDVIQFVLQRLQEQGLQSDQRFVESFIRSRAYSGKGPLRLREELQQKHVNSMLISEGLEAFEGDWDEVLREAWEKKFNTLPKDDKEKAKQLRFLAYRGFSANAIFKLFTQLKEN